ncbi:MAG: hypothetical protein J4F42_17865 [Desulfurellaceae bacterium]|nr:hypothetical protein [Desulfurellaceae bacterium]
MKRYAFVLAVVLTSVFGLGAVDAYADPARRWSGPGWPDAYGPRHRGPRFGNFATRIAGTYLIRDGDAETVSLRLISLTADGNWSGTHSHQQAPGLSFSDQHGVWKRSGRREITASVLDFGIDEATGRATEVVRARYVMTFSRDLQEVSGEYAGEAFALDQDPFDPDAVPISGFDNTFTGHRLTVDLD